MVENETKKPVPIGAAREDEYDEEMQWSIFEAVQVTLEATWLVILAVGMNLWEAGKNTKIPVPMMVALGVLFAAVCIINDTFGIIGYSLDFHPNPNRPDECFPAPVAGAWPLDSANRLRNASHRFNTPAPGPESLAWDSQGRIYTGVADGRVIRWSEKDRKWETFATASPYWSPELCGFEHRGKNYPALEYVCGRPLGLKFDASDSLYIADSYFGLSVVGPEGGVARILCGHSEGKLHQFTNDLDIDNDARVVYFTVSSLRTQRKRCNLVVQEGDETGRIIKYEIGTGRTTVIEKDIFYPNGIALSADKSFLLVVSTTTNRIQKLWLTGEKAGESEIFAKLPGYGDNVRATEDGRFFWVALHNRRTTLHHYLCQWDWFHRLVTPLALMSKRVEKLVAGPATPIVIKYDMNGEAVEVLEDITGKSPANFISSAVERQGTLWLSSIYLPAIYTYELQ
ncbi:hypothetical protein R1sor_022107 [Riccia sorocarpa]|uniref:Strictosidine synthase conserved region domain-containing protein n=1 Tax=Riccia sorocarpa TaxID=122646 RepID=A0ABD3GMQ5_9MARC